MGIGNAAVICALRLLLLFVYWEYCCYMCIGNIVIIFVFVMMLLFVY
jgi:hypothetical protein